MDEFMEILINFLQFATTKTSYKCIKINNRKGKQSTACTGVEEAYDIEDS